MTFSLIGHVAVGGNGSVATTAGITTTGANLIVVTVAHGGGADPTITDSKGNTYTKRGSYQVPASNQTIILYDAVAPTVGASHTFTATTSSDFPSIAVTAWSGASATPFDTQTGNGSLSSGTIQPGSITPAESNELFITGVQDPDATGSLSINSGFTISDQLTLSGGLYYGQGHAYFVQGSAAALNPTWTNSFGAGPIVAVMATYKAAAAATQAWFPFTQDTYQPKTVTAKPEQAQFLAWAPQPIAAPPVAPPFGWFSGFADPPSKHFGGSLDILTAPQPPIAPTAFNFTVGFEYYARGSRADYSSIVLPPTLAVAPPIAPPWFDLTSTFATVPQRKTFDAQFSTQLFSPPVSIAAPLNWFPFGGIGFDYLPTRKTPFADFISLPAYTVAPAPLNWFPMTVGFDAPTRRARPDSNLGFFATNPGPLPPLPTALSVSPGSLIPGSTGDTVTLTGLNTKWLTTAPTFTLTSTGTGASITGQSIISDTSATITVSAGTVGTITITDPSTGKTASISVRKPGKDSYIMRGGARGGIDRSGMHGSMGP